MKKLLIITIIALNALSVFAQTQKYDIYSYTPPKGWEAQNGSSAKVFTKIDKAKNSLGIIMLYPSIDSSGDANEDFKYVWKQIVQDSFGASANPEIETGEQNGFTVVNGGEMIKYEGIQALAMLTVLSGKGKVISVLTITNEQSYANVTQSLIDGMSVNIPDSPAKSTPTTSNNSNSTTYSGNGSVSDYSFTTPKGWTRENNSGEIVLRKDQNQYVISFLPMIKSSGNLETDVENICWQVFKGWSPWGDTNGFKPDYGTFEKGKTSQGLDYFMKVRYLKNNADDQKTLDAIILVIKAGTNVAVITAAQPLQSISDASAEALDFILYDFNLKNVGGTVNLQKELLGSWSSVGSVALSDTYHPNGTFSFAGASQFRTSRDAYTDNVTTTSFSSDGTYKLAGNLMTKFIKKSGKTLQYRVRFFYTKYDKDEWQYKMGLLPSDSSDGRGIVYSKDK
jgi:hypothetical protein